MMSEPQEIADQEPWEYFAGSLDRRLGSTRRLRRVHTGEVVRCLTEAGVELIEWLTSTREWPWFEARLLAGRFIDRSADWAASGDGEEALEANLRAVWEFDGSEPRHVGAGSVPLPR